MLENLLLVAEGDAVTTTTYLHNAIEGIPFGNILAEITSVAPDLIPVAIACLAFRKGISFMFSILRGA